MVSRRISQKRSEFSIVSEWLIRGTEIYVYVCIYIYICCTYMVVSLKGATSKSAILIGVK